MTPPTDPDWTARYQRILGDELRHARKMRGWTRRQLHSKLLGKFGLDISLQTLATYEFGTRSVPHVRLVQIALALEVNLPELLTRVIRRVFADDEAHADGWDIDLDAASELDDPQLLPLRRWARCRLRDTGTPVPGTSVPMIVRLGLTELGDLAMLCGVDMLELARQLPRPCLAGGVTEGV